MTPVIASWSLPFCTPESDKSKLEESLFLNELQQSVSLEGSKSDLMELASQHLQSVVKLFALACKAERETRASDIASMVSSAKGIQMMCNYAAKLKKHTLVDKVASIGRKNISTNNYLPSESTQQDYNVLDAECDNYSSCEDDLAPNTNETLDETIESVNDCTQLPLQRLGHNPFKRSGSSTTDNSISMFDQMDLSFNNPRKKMKDIDVCSI
uniref:Chromatin complexes subunit BAP18 n=1 Tax=Heterorhabditis bacteriophora TaxID=37862 RepID=A0A1I7XLW3_HETBA